MSDKIDDSVEKKHFTSILYFIYTSYEYMKYYRQPAYDSVLDIRYGLEDSDSNQPWKLLLGSLPQPISVDCSYGTLGAKKI